MIHFLSKLHISDMARIVYIFCELKESGRGPLAILAFTVHDLYINYVAAQFIHILSQLEK